MADEGVVFFPNCKAKIPRARPLEMRQPNGRRSRDCCPPSRARLAAAIAGAEERFYTDGSSGSNTAGAGPERKRSGPGVPVKFLTTKV
jgi:hypothetical protein